jgi:DNA invertase Pin-like site-specific DNA recombinase
MLVGYARVSTGDQLHDLQLKALKAAGCEKIFTETVSGAARERPELERALTFARKGDVLTVWKLDRLGRSLIDLLLLLERLEHSEVELRSVTEAAIDTTSPHGRALFGMAGVFAQWERDMNRQRTMAGLAAARARGAKPGRKFILTPEQERQVAALHAAEIPPREICRQFNIGRRTMWRTIVRVADRDREQRRLAKVELERAAAAGAAARDVSRDQRDQRDQRNQRNQRDQQAG